MVVLDLKHETLKDDFLGGKLGERKPVEEDAKVGKGSPRKLSFSRCGCHVTDG